MLTLRIFGKRTDGKRVELLSPLDFRFQADRFIPCDSLSFSVPLPMETGYYYEIEVLLDGELLFDGIVDRQISEKSDSGRLLRFECRSRAALLLDNEVKPYVYFQMTSDQLFSRYARPFGVTGAQFPFPGKRGFLQVKKGASHWKVISDFCLLVYKAQPYLNRRKQLVLSPLNDRIIVLDNHGDGVRYTAISISQRNDKLISRLYMKTATETYGYYYGVAIDNPVAQSRQVQRERYYHPQYKVAAEATDESRRIVAESNRDSFEAVVVVPGFLNADIGDEVQLPAEAVGRRLVISGLEYRLSAGAGKITRLTLSDRAYLMEVFYVDQ